MNEKVYNNLEGEEIEKLFSSLKETDNGTILLQKGCKTDDIDEESIFNALCKGWSVVM